MNKIILPLEVLRLICSFLIVTFHSGLNFLHEFAYSGLLVFIIISFYLQYSRPLAPKLILNLAKRVIIPWAFWFIVYGVGNLFLHKDFLDVESGLVMGILSGTMIHLWYLPFIFINFFVSNFILLRFGIKRVVYYCMVLFFLSILTVPIWRPWSLVFGSPVSQYMQALPAVLIGLALPFIFKERVSVICLYFVSLILISSMALNYVGIGLSYIFALILLFTFLVLMKNWKIDDRVLLFSQLTYGIYLMHPIFLYLFKSCLKLATLWHAPLAFVAAMFTTYFIKALFPRVSKFVM